MAQFPSWGIYLPDITLQEKIKIIQADYRLYALPKGYSEGAVVAGTQLSYIVTLLSMVNGARTIVRDDEQGNITIIRFDRALNSAVSKFGWKLLDIPRLADRMNGIKNNIHLRNGNPRPTFHRKLVTLLRGTLCRYLRSPNIDLYFSPAISCPSCTPHVVVSHFAVYFNYECIESTREPLYYQGVCLRGKYSSLGIPIEIEGYTVGELFPDALYIFGALHERMPSRIMHFVEKILLQACTLLGKELPKPSQSVKMPVLSDIESENNKVLQILQHRKREELNQRYAERNRLNDRAANLVRDLTACYTEISRLGQIIIMLEQSQDSGLELSNMCNRILSLPLVESIAAVPNTNSSFIVVTKPIHTLPVANKIYNLGRYVLRFDVNGGYINVKSLELPYDSQNQAPHVGASGTPCYGNIAPAVTELLAQNNYPALVQLMLTFLRNVNTHDDWGQRITLWPTIETEKKEEVPTVAVPSQEAIDTINAI